MLERDRRTTQAIAGGAWAAGAVLIAPGGSHPNDARLYALVDAWVAVANHKERIHKINSRRWRCDADDGPLAYRLFAADARENAVALEIARTPADTVAGMDAKWRLNGFFTEKMPGPNTFTPFSLVVRAAYLDADRLGVARVRG